MLGYCHQRAGPGADTGPNRHAESADPCALYSRHGRPTAGVRADAVERDGASTADNRRDQHGHQRDHSRRWRRDSVDSEYGDPSRHHARHAVESVDRLDGVKAGDYKLSIADVFAAATDDILVAVTR